MPDTLSIPGDVIASIEEYESGRNTFDDGDKIRSAVVGTPITDIKSRVASIKRLKDMPIPGIGDVVVGTVAAVMGQRFAVAIRFINGKAVTSGVECSCSTRDIRKKLVALVGDVVTLRIISHINGAIHATVMEADLGVVFTKCRKCGGGVITDRGGVKCAECSWFDERKLSSKFGDKRLAGG